MRSALVLLLLAAVIPASGVEITGIVIEPVAIGSSGPINKEVLAPIPGSRKIVFLDYVNGQLGRASVDGGPPEEVVPFAAPAGEVISIRSAAVFAKDKLYYFMAYLEKPADQTFRSVIGRIDPNALSTPIQYFNIPTPAACQALSYPCSITASADGNALFFTESREDKIGKMTLDGTFTEFPIQSGSRTPSVLWNITAAASGNLWMTDPTGDAIWRMTPSGVASRFEIDPDPNRPFIRPTGIAAHPNGNTYAGTEGPNGNSILEISPAGAIQELKFPTPGNRPYAIAIGTDSNVYFTDPPGKTIGQMLLPSHEIRESSVTNGDTPQEIWGIPSALAGVAQFVINGYSSSFDFRPQLVTVDVVDSPPPAAPVLAITIDFSPSLPAGTTPQFVVGSTVKVSFKVENVGKVATIGPWFVSGVATGLKRLVDASLDFVIADTGGLLKLTPIGGTQSLGAGQEALGFLAFEVTDAAAAALVLRTEGGGSSEAAAAVGIEGAVERAYTGLLRPTFSQGIRF